MVPMDPGTTTCWTIVEGARAGDRHAREEFSRRYLPVVRAYLRRRWAGTGWLDEVDDTVQELFLECFKERGALERLDAGRPGGFRAYLYGVTRNVAGRVETRGARRRERNNVPGAGLDRVVADEATLSQVFDRAWALALIREAIVRLERREKGGGCATRHAELLRLRFSEDLPIREIAARWGVDPAQLHHAYAAARGGFKRCLLDVVGEHHGGTRGDLERRCADLLQIIQ